MTNNMDLHGAMRAYYAEYAIHRTWLETANQAMAYLASTGKPFTGDDLKDLLKDCGEPHHPNVIGGLFKRWARDGLIRKDMEHSGYSRTHGGFRFAWVGKASAKSDAA